MNEGIAPFLNIKVENWRDNERLIQKIDNLLLQCGLKYSGVMNIYIPMDSKKRDDVAFNAIKALHHCEWLKGIIANVCITQEVNVCELSDVITHNMSQPKKEKFEYYERYFKQTNQLPHAILVDEDKVIRDGYITYLLAQKYNVKANVMNVVLGMPICKIVYGRHVEKDNNNFVLKNDKTYIWKYNLKEPVVPDDILEVSTAIGNAFIRVDKIDYVTGKKFCSQHKKVIKHMHRQMEEEG